MEHKAPGTTPRPGGYGSTSASEPGESLLRPRYRAATANLQRVSLRMTKRVIFLFTLVVVGVVMLPAYAGPVYVQYTAGKQWLLRARKAIWQRRNEKDYDLYLAQRQNSWWQWLGLKRYNIGGDDNDGDIQRYR